jgi:caffeoyl-CoA O-methyltransferase
MTSFNYSLFPGNIMLEQDEYAAIDRLWQRKLQQDAAGLPQAERHRNLEPPSAELLHALVAGTGAKRLLEIGGSTGISTIALAAAARETGGRLTSIEIEAKRQAESRQTLHELGLDKFVEFICDDAANVLPRLAELDFALIDCEKEDYIRFFDMLHIAPGGFVVADNIISHSLQDYVSHVRQRPGVESMTLPIGKGLEVTRFASQL